MSVMEMEFPFLQTQKPPRTGKWNSAETVQRQLRHKNIKVLQQFK